MRSRFLLLAAVTLSLVALMGGAAYGQVTYTSPGECYACHGLTGTGAVSKVEFDVPAVNYARCADCHKAISTAQHWHNPNSTYSTCTGCHRTVVPIITNTAWRFTSKYVSTDFGRFKSSASLSSTPQALHAAHAGTGWVNSLVLKAGSTANCANCHRSVACSACHTDAVNHTEHATPEYPAVSYLQSTGTGTTTAPSTCVNSACHSPAKAATADFVPWCGTCHESRVSEHGYDTVDHVADDGSLQEIECSACHQLDLAATHGDPGAEGASCATCHPTPRDSLGAWDQTCATGSCHTAGSTAPMHEGTATAHAVSTENELCLDCHPGTDLGAIHVDAADDTGKTSCLVCHTGAEGEPATADCTVCHFTFDAHYDESVHLSSWTLVGCGGSGCHGTRDLMGAHTEKNPEFTCDGCHKDFSVALQIEQGLTGCGDCHDNIYQTSGHRAAHAPNPPLTDSSGPRYSYYTGSAGSAPTNDCIGCHTSNLVDEHMGMLDQDTGLIVRLPRYDTTGAPLTCDSCHAQPEGTAVRTAIATGQGACENCHTVHGPMHEVHASAFVDAPFAPCADCHNANLAVEHNGGYTSSAGLTGCDVCHALYTGELAGSVQAAISTANDTACDACHATYHDDPTVHQAATAQSLSCGACHARGADTIDVTALHADSAAGPCKVCHASQRVGAISGHTAECGSCHSTEGEDYHTDMAASHTYSAMPQSCTSSDTCHVANDLAEEHERFCAEQGYSSACDLCHENTDPDRIDWDTATSDCSSCHTVHGDVGVVHTAVSSQACVDCHETAQTLEIHQTADGVADCAMCHSAPAGRIDWTTATIECRSCHASLLPVESAHYPSAQHLASTPAECGECHSRDMKAEHSKPTVGVGCVTCHEVKLDGFTTAWDKTCEACHPTKHANEAAAHRSTNTTCAGTGCHVVTNVATLHGTACIDCHGAGITPSTTCTTCHTAANPHHSTITVKMTSDSAWVTVCGSCHGRVHGRGSCSRCHSNDMHGESAHISSNTRCAGCHKIAAADTTDNCLACHKNLSSGSGSGWGGGSWGR